MNKKMAIFLVGLAYAGIVSGTIICFIRYMAKRESKKIDQETEREVAAIEYAGEIVSKKILAGEYFDTEPERMLKDIEFFRIMYLSQE